MENSENIEIQESSVKETENTFNLLKEVWEWVYTIAIALVIAFVIKGYLFDIVRVDGPSMNPTLTHNDRLIVTKLGYEPEQGDIVILDSAYKNRMEYYEDYENTNGELGVFKKMVEYTKLPDSLKRRYYVKRIIAMEGDTVDIINGEVIVNGEILEEEYYDGVTFKTDPATEYPFTVSEGHVFVMGDNRANSKDSRSTSLGEVPVEALMGKAQVRVWPIAGFGKVD